VIRLTQNRLLVCQGAGDFIWKLKLGLKAMNKTDTNATTIETQDPHAAWWTEHQRLAAEHDNRYLVRGEEADAEAERGYRRLAELEDLLRNTPVKTFEVPVSSSWPLLWPSRTAWGTMISRRC
jgi:hypothetical protein